MEYQEFEDKLLKISKEFSETKDITDAKWGLESMCIFVDTPKKNDLLTAVCRFMFYPVDVVH